MNIENEKDLQVWLEIYKVIITDNPEVIFNDCAGAADEAFKQYKKRAKALEGAADEDSWIWWHGVGTERDTHPVGAVVVEVAYRDGNKDYGPADEFSWIHLGCSSDIVKFKFV